MSGDTCLVTGGAGFIGSHLTEALLADGMRVRVLDNCVNGSEDNIKHLFGRNDFEFVKADILDELALKKAFKSVGRVYHLACLGVRHSLLHPMENHRVNAEGTLLVLRAALDAKVERFVNVASSEIYGTAVRVPMDEEHPTHPTTVYGAGKLAGEAYARAFHTTYGLKTVMLRPFNTFGPRSHHEGDCGEAIPKFIIRALKGEDLLIFGDGSQTRDFTFVKDMAHGMVLAADREELIGGTWNLGSGSSIRIDALAAKIIQLTGASGVKACHIQSRPGDVGALHADASRYQKITGWQPSVGLAGGLQATLEYFKNHPKGLDKLIKEEVPVCWENAK